MKKTVLFLSGLALFIAACGGSTSESEQNSSAATTAPAAAPAQSEMDPGELLIVKSDCIGCHNKENKIIGPSYLEIAAKYPSTDENINLLAGKILKGGKGVWGSVPMTAHPKLTEDQAKTIVKYILSLKK